MKIERHMGEESMKINKIRFLEPGNLPYRRSIKNLYVYDQYIRTLPTA